MELLCTLMALPANIRPIKFTAFFGKNDRCAKAGDKRHLAFRKLTAPAILCGISAMRSEPLPWSTLLPVAAH
jgi:hypothetical protein